MNLPRRSFERLFQPGSQVSIDSIDLLSCYLLLLVVSGWNVQHSRLQVVLSELVPRKSPDWCGGLSFCSG